MGAGSECPGVDGGVSFRNSCGAGGGSGGRLTFSHWEDPSRIETAELVIAGPAAVTAVFTRVCHATGTIEVRHIFSGPLHEGGTIAGPAAAHPAGSQWVEDWGELESDSDELVIGLDPDLDPAEGRQLLEELGFEVLDTLPVIGAYLVKHRVDGEIQALAAELRGYPIRYVQPNGTVRAMGPVEPSDPLFRRQWHYKLIRLPLLGQLSRAALRTGAGYGHRSRAPDLASN